MTSGKTAKREKNVGRRTTDECWGATKLKPSNSLRAFLYEIVPKRSMDSGQDVYLIPEDAELMDVGVEEAFLG